jgi:hypothetical protein
MFFEVQKIQKTQFFKGKLALVGGGDHFWNFV